MKIAIIYVRTDLWAARAVQDLLAQERHCLKYADELESKVVKFFREKPSHTGKRKQLLEMLLYLEKNSGHVDYLIVQSPGILAKYKMDFIPLLKNIRNLGTKVAFVIYKDKSHQTHEEKNKRS
jgi:DNA invertase Pin-like site-specific DNA recombinase